MTDQTTNDQTPPEPPNDGRGTTPVQTPTPAATGTEPGKQAGNQPQEKTFTQAELDQMINARLEKERNATLKKLGVEKLDDAVGAVSKVKEITDAQKTAEQKLQDQLTEATAKATTAEEKRQRALIRAAVIAEASKPGMVAGDRLEAAYKLMDTTKLKVNDNDDVEGVADALKELLEANPFLKADPAKPTPQPKIPASNPAGSGTGERDMSWHPLNRNKDVRIGGAGVINNKE